MNKQLSGLLFLVSLCMALPQTASSMTLEEAMASAYETNPRIHAQRKRLEETNEGVAQAVSGFRPTITGLYSDGRQRTRFDSPKWSAGDSRTQQITLEQPLFRGGGTLAQYSAAKNLVEAGRADLRTTEQEVLLDTVLAYMDMVQNRAILALSESNENVLREQLRASQDRFDVGEVTRTDVAQSESRLARAQSDSIQAGGDLESSIAEFIRVTGVEPGEEQAFPAEYPGYPKTLQEVIDRALENSPTIVSTRYQRDAADDAIGTNVASLLPQVSLVGTMQREDGAGVLGASQFDSDSLVVQVNIPIYQAGQAYSQVRASKLAARRSDFQLTDAQDAAREAAIQAWENLQTSIATIAAQEEESRAAEIALDGVRQEQQYGSRTVLDVLDAEQELFISRVNLVRAQRNRAVSIYNLLLVMGDLTADNLELGVDSYNVQEHYDDVRWQSIGF